MSDDIKCVYCIIIAIIIYSNATRIHLFAHPLLSSRKALSAINRFEIRLPRQGKHLRQPHLNFHPTVHWARSTVCILYIPISVADNACCSSNMNDTYIVYIQTCCTFHSNSFDAFKSAENWRFPWCSMANAWISDGRIYLYNIRCICVAIVCGSMPWRIWIIHMEIAAYRTRNADYTYIYILSIVIIIIRRHPCAIVVQFHCICSHCALICEPFKTYSSI